LNVQRENFSSLKSIEPGAFLNANKTPGNKISLIENGNIRLSELPQAF